MSPSLLLRGAKRGFISHFRTSFLEYSYPFSRQERSLSWISNEAFIFRFRLHTSTPWGHPKSVAHFHPAVRLRSGLKIDCRDPSPTRVEKDNPAGLQLCRIVLSPESVPGDAVIVDEIACRDPSKVKLDSCVYKTWDVLIASTLSIHCNI